MKFSFTVVSLLAAVASTSAVIIRPRQSLPSCAAPCIANAQTGNCDPTDDSCLCRNNDFITSTSSCINSSCSGSDLQNAIEASEELCLAVGVTLTSSTPAATSTTPSSGSTSAAAATSSAATSAASSSASASTTNGARANAANAMVGLAAIGLVAVAL